VASVVLVASDNMTSGMDLKEALKKIFKINVKRAHECLEHLSKDTTRMTAKYFGMNLLHDPYLFANHAQLQKQSKEMLQRRRLGRIRLRNSTVKSSTILLRLKSQKNLERLKLPDQIGIFSLTRQRDSSKVHSLRHAPQKGLQSSNLNLASG
jgi:hypothetical protein